MRLEARADGGGSCDLSDVQLQLPMVEGATRLVNGFGYKGARRPDEVIFKWDAEVTELTSHNQKGLDCRVWLGGADAGLQINLQGVEQAKQAASSHCGNNDRGELVCDDLIDAQYNVALGSAVWFNRNKGGATVKLMGPSVVARLRQLRQLSSSSTAAAADNGGGGGGGGARVAMVTIYTGMIRVSALEPLVLPLRLLLTPVRGAGGPRTADFDTRYFHMQRFTTVAKATSAAPHPWIILHQGNQLNPYINYPFLTVEPLRQYVKEAHAAGAKVKLYYTVRVLSTSRVHASAHHGALLSPQVRELSTSATELWALRSLNGEVLIPSKVEGGHAWLREHVRTNYSAAWHERLADGEVDSSVHTPAFTTRWDNYWIEGILWLVRNLDIDGIYLDGAPYERNVLRRLRAALEPITAHRPNPFLLDLHASCFGHPHLPYMELYPFIDSIWYGEQCNYIGYSPEQWLAEVGGIPECDPECVPDCMPALTTAPCPTLPPQVAGIPFGLPGQMLGDNRDQFHGLVFGMTCRIYPDPDRCNPRPLWAALDGLGMRSPRMIGWWERLSPVAARPAEHVKATLFIGSRGGQPTFAIALANWGRESVQATLTLDLTALEALGLHVPGGGDVRMSAPAISGFQVHATWALGAPITLQAKGSGSEGKFVQLVTV